MYVCMYECKCPGREHEWDHCSVFIAYDRNGDRDRDKKVSKQKGEREKKTICEDGDSGTVHNVVQRKRKPDIDEKKSTNARKKKKSTTRTTKTPIPIFDPSRQKKKPFLLSTVTPHLPIKTQRSSPPLSSSHPTHHHPVQASSKATPPSLASHPHTPPHPDPEQGHTQESSDTPQNTIS